METEKMTNHPTQGLQDMTLDLSTYSTEALAELQTRIEEEKTKRELKVPFEVSPVSFNDDGHAVMTINYPSSDKFIRNHYLRLSAEAKLRAAGGGSHKLEEREWTLSKLINPTICYADSPRHYNPQLGAIYFKDAQSALEALRTLTPDEQAAIFGFGEE